MRDSYKRRVARGVKLLNINVPGWVDRVNLADLDMRSPCDCVLGQLFKSECDLPIWGFSRGLKVLNLENELLDQQAYYGFELSQECFRATNSMKDRAKSNAIFKDHSTRLKNAWIEAIIKLRAKKALENN